MLHLHSLIFWFQWVPEPIQAALHICDTLKLCSSLLRNASTLWLCCATLPSPVTLTNLTMVFIKGNITNLMHSVLYTPATPRESQQTMASTLMMRPSKTRLFNTSSTPPISLVLLSTEHWASVRPNLWLTAERRWVMVEPCLRLPFSVLPSMLTASSSMESSPFSDKA